MPDYRHDSAKVSAVGGKSQYKEAVTIVRSDKRMHFASLHHHSTYSYLDGYGLPESHVRRAAELNMSALALTEHGNVSSHVKLEQAAKRHDVKPIFGCELYTGEIDHERRQQKKNHLTLLAADEPGYRNLLRIVSRGWSEGFYYEPTVNGRILADHQEGIIVLSGCLGSLLATSLIGGKGIDEADASYQRGKAVAQRFKRLLGDRYYLECQAFPELEKTKQVNRCLADLSEELDIPLAATLDCHYTIPDESDMQMILHNVRGGGKQSLEDQARSWGYDVKLCPPPTDNDIYSKLRHTGLTKQQAMAAIMNTEEIAGRCNVVLPKLEQITFPLPRGYMCAQDVWKAWLHDGWIYRGIELKSNKAEYIKRVKYEMSIIEQKEFIDYFLVVSDIVKYAKDSGIPVGPARGSAAASLVCYLLRITEVDPMMYSNLVFERFIDISREDLPDIDLDFDDERRSLIREYAVRKYGADRVSNIGTFTTYKSKNSLDDIARVYKIPKYKVDDVKSVMIERSSGDLRASATIEDTVEQFEDAKATFDEYPELYKAMRLEGNLRGMGVHAAGLIISNRPITDICAVYARQNVGDNSVTDVISLDKYDAEYLGMLKIDVLGLSTMGILRLAIEMIGMSLEELYAIPLDDPDTLEGFRRNDVTGIFQFDGRAMRFVNGALRPDDFTEVCHVNALARPGPLHNQATTEYVEIKYGSATPERLHPMLDDITGPTHYQIIYQEQILRIVREIGLFDWTAAGYIRKIISRKLGEQEFNRQWERFWEGAQTHDGMTEEIAKRIWGACITAGSYCFNYAHACAYGMLGWWCVGGATRLYDWDQQRYRTISECFRNGIDRVACYDSSTKQTIPGKVRKVIKAESKKTGFKVTLASRKKLVTSKDHKFLTPDGYKRQEELRIGDQIAAERRVNNHPPGVGAKISEGKRKYWAQFSPEQRKEMTKEFWSVGSADKQRENYQNMSAEERYAKVAPWIEAAAKSANGGRYHRSMSIGSCGLKVYSKGESAICDWLSLNNIDHSHQTLLPNGRPADFYAKGVYIECDGIDRPQDYWGDKYEETPVIVTNQTTFEDDLHFLLEEEDMRAGREVVWDTIIEIQSVGDKVMYDIAMEDEPHNFLANGMVVHNCMFMKTHHPVEFYISSLMKHTSKENELLRDAVRHGIKINPPHPAKSQATWTDTSAKSEKAITAGFRQIHGIGDKMADRILLSRAETPLESWDDLTKVKGIGPKKSAVIKEFVEQDDPFRIHYLRRTIEAGKKAIKLGLLGDLPIPSHATGDIPFRRTGRDETITWLGVIQHRNVRDLFEVNMSRTGIPLDPDKVRDPHLNEWMVMQGADDDGILTVRVDRWKYPHYRKSLWDMKLDHDLVLAIGKKPGNQSVKMIFVQKIWILSPNIGGPSDRN